MDTKVNQIKHEVATEGLKTYATTNYAMFLMLEDNRMINWNHVGNLIESMKLYPQGMLLEPMLVNEKLEIIDGQHRLKAREKMGLPVYYQIVEGLDINDTVRMNVYRRNWTPMDFAYSYAARGNTNYSRYITTHEAYPELQHRTLVTYMTNTERNNMDADFRKGLFVLHEKDEDIKARIDRYNEIATSLPRRDFATNRSFQRAVLSIMKHPQYDHERMMGKMEFAATKFLSQPFIKTEDAERALEGVYNERARDNDRVRFF